MARVATWIVSINDLYKKFSPTYNLDTSSLKVHMQEIVSILWEIISSAKSSYHDLLPIVQINCLPIQQEVIALWNYIILSTEIETPNKTILLTAPMDEMSNQPIPIAELRAPVPNKTTLSVPLAYEALN